MTAPKSFSSSDIAEYVERHIGAFHEKRLKSLQELKLNRIIRRKNPYLFKAKNILTAQDFVKILLDAHLSSQEETIFGDFMEGLAVFVCKKAYGGRKSSAIGIDLEFESANKRYIVAVKSGPNWGNSSQIAKMQQDFRRARQILRGKASMTEIIAVNGCCYGKDNKPDKGDYFKFCGQKFWEFVSGDSDFYVRIIEPLGHMAKEKNEEFLKSYSGIINNFTYTFIKDFCVDGRIDWEAVVRFNSASKEP